VADLADAGGRLRHAACSSEQMRVAELFELQLKQGPCFDAYDRRAYVESGSPEDALTRWPAFTPHAVENGFLAVFAVPLRLRDQVIGALNLFSSARGRAPRGGRSRRAGNGRHRNDRNTPRTCGG
jgi:hypothetical protein